MMNNDKQQLLCYNNNDMQIKYYEFPLQTNQYPKPKQSKQVQIFEDISPIKLESKGNETEQKMKMSILDIPTLYTQPQQSEQWIYPQEKNRSKQIRKQALNLFETSAKKKSFNKDITIIQNPTYEEILSKNFKQETRRNSKKQFEGTFKPHQINQQSCNRISLQNKDMKKNSVKKNPHKKEIQNYLLGDGPVVAKTKYERILKEHLESEKIKNVQKEEKTKQRESNIKKINAQSKIIHQESNKKESGTLYHINQYSIDRKKQTHKTIQNHSYSATKRHEKKYSEPSPAKKKCNNVTKKQLISEFETKKKYKQVLANPKNLIQQKPALQKINCRRGDSIIQLSSVQANSQQDSQIINQSRSGYSKKCAQEYPVRKGQRLEGSKSEKWIEMNFHDRQKKVLENRKEKEKAGRQKKIEEEIKGCTFQPNLNTKVRVKDSMQQNKNSYLQQYFDRVYRKY